MFKGCSACSADACTKCIDEEANIFDGRCVCEDGFNEDGTCKKKVSTSNCLEDEVMVEDKCQKCSELMEGCTACSSADTCTKCTDPHASIKDGKCICKNGVHDDNTCVHLPPCDSNEVEIGKIC